MLRSKAVCLLLPTLLFTIPSNNNTLPQLETERLVEVEGFEPKNYYYENPKMKAFEENTNKLIKEKEIEQQKKEEQLRKQLEEQKRKEEEKKKGTRVRLLCTYYGNTKSQCGNNKGIMANGNKVYYGAIAVPHSIPLGSKIVMEESGREFIASDRGNSKYICQLGENYYRVDIFIPRLESEINDDDAYERRVRAMGTDDVYATLYLDK